MLCNRFTYLIVLNFSWFTQSQASTATDKDTEAKNSIRQFYSFVVNGVIYAIHYSFKYRFHNCHFFSSSFYSNFDVFSQMDVRYKTIQSSYTISILYAGIYIADVCMLNHMYERYKKLF